MRRISVPLGQTPFSFPFSFYAFLCSLLWRKRGQAHFYFNKLPRSKLRGISKEFIPIAASCGESDSHRIQSESALDHPGPCLLSSPRSACHGAWPRVAAHSLARSYPGTGRYPAVGFDSVPNGYPPPRIKGPGSLYSEIFFTTPRSEGLSLKSRRLCTMACKFGVRVKTA
jgi:hypothetical protein